MKTRFYYDNGLILLSALVSGEKRKNMPVILALDTGSFFTNLKPDILERVGAIPTKEIAFLLGVGEKVKSEFAILESFSAFGISAKHFKVTSHSLPNDYPIDGLLGNEFLRHHKIFIDFPNGIISIE